MSGWTVTENRWKEGGEWHGGKLSACCWNMQHSLCNGKDCTCHCNHPHLGTADVAEFLESRFLDIPDAAFYDHAAKLAWLQEVQDILDKLKAEYGN